ncbi:MAG: SigB/SigF/SigG family RNA polymerase sigma factor [Oscillospiraceae bacterium]|nr:SigB/SigF/SigG family RNA polymerase sigma factor [Oscillospiraceae bacterium]
MYSSKVEICGVNTSLLPVLTEQQKTELLLAAREGNAEARQQMIQGNLRLVLSVVQKFSGRGENLDDLFQVGCIGLIKAIDNFDPNLNVRFSTYGVPMILGEIRRFLRDNNPVRVSRSIRDLAYHSMQAREALQKETGREPRVNEIAQRVGNTPENVAMALESVIEPASLYEPAYTDGDDTLSIIDRVPETSGEDSWISGIMFRDTVQQLSDRERKIIALRYLSGQTQMQVAKKIGISQAQVSRLEKSALCRIREQISCR